MDEDEGVDPAISLSNRKYARNMLIPGTTNSRLLLTGWTTNLK